MANIQITISLPILIGTQKFKVRYRLVGGAYSAYQDETNAPFTLTGLAVGNYELEIILVLEDLTECAPAYEYFSVNEEFTCYTGFGAVINQDSNGNYFVQLNYTPPLPIGAATLRIYCTVHAGG